MKIFLYKVFNLKQGELRLLCIASLFIFLLFSSYAILRPIRDSLGLSGGSEELKWLFLGTFVSTLLGAILAMILSTKVKRKNYLNGIYIFFIINLLLFFLAFEFFLPHSVEFLWLSRVFYIWVSVFNLFIISSAWSLLSDIFNKERSQRLFGIISAGASLGSIMGAVLVSFLVGKLGSNNFLLLSMILLFLTLIFKGLLLKSTFAILESEEKNNFISRFNSYIGSKNPFIGFWLILRSPYLMGLACFVVLLTSVSTFLYMEQGRIIQVQFPTKELRAAAFANIDLIVQSVSFFIQIFFTARLTQIFGLKTLLGALGFVIAIGFIVLIFTHPLFLPMIVVMSIRRIGEYAFIKPGREMLFVPLDSDSKYKVKSFLDTVVYRGGDALSAQLEGVLVKMGIGIVLGCGAILACLWGILGVFLGRKYEKDL